MAPSGLTIENQNTPLCYIARNGMPLLAFGCHFEHMFFDDYDYESWSDWAAAHGINHCRTRLFYTPFQVSPRRKKPAYSPFLRTDNGKFDLTRWDETYWNRFHRICSYLQAKDIIIHLLIFPQCTGAYWPNRAWVYHPDNNVHPQTEFLRSETTSEAFWQTLPDGPPGLYEIQIAVLMKLIEESARYDNIYYDLCHEPFVFAMSEEARAGMRRFLEETTARFHARYRELRPGTTPLVGIDTDFTPPGRMRDWLYGHERLTIMIKGNNNDELYTSSLHAMDLRRRFAKPFCPQESCDPPRIDHIPGCEHTQNLTYYWPRHRTHLRKYVWRWVMAKSQIIDIYQKGMGDVEEVYADRSDADPEKTRMRAITDRERYDPRGHNPFEEDALILRRFWNGLRDYPNLDMRGDLLKIHFRFVKRVLSSSREAMAYLSSEPGRENVAFAPRTIRLINLALRDGTYAVDLWTPAAPGGITATRTERVEKGAVSIPLPAFTDDIAIHIHEPPPA